MPAGAAGPGVLLMREEQKLAATTGSRHYKRVVAGEGIEALAEAINGDIHAFERISVSTTKDRVATAAQ